MVGVPGRSKGCHTCRKRKIACSLEKPQCGQCVKSNRVCAGYERERVFIINDFSTGPMKIVTHKAVHASKKSPPVKASPETNTPRGDDDISKSLVLDGNVHWSVIQELSALAPMRQQLIGSFLSCYYPQKMQDVAQEKSWLMILAELPSPSIALEKSTLAICTARLGRTKSDDVLIRKSLKWYTDGLHELQKALYDRKLMYKDETLGACMALATYEMMECPEGSKYAYASHHSGCSRLIQLRGIEAHTSGLGHQLFVAFRVQSIMNALDTHRKTYLSEPAWLNAPWAKTAKKPYDRLLDILALAPAIFQRVDELSTLPPWERLPSVLTTINDCWHVDAEQERFFDEFKASYPPGRSLYWSEKSTYRNKLDKDSWEPTFPTAYHFPDLQTARVLILYWSMLNMLWTGMVRLYEVVAGISILSGMAFESHKLRPLEHRADFMVSARKVFRSVEYLMQGKMLGLGPQAVVAPLSIVVETIRDFNEYATEVAWGDEVLREIKGRGLRILGCDKKQ